MHECFDLSYDIDLWYGYEMTNYSVVTLKGFSFLELCIVEYLIFIATCFYGGLYLQLKKNQFSAEKSQFSAKKINLVPKRFNLVPKNIQLNPKTFQFSAEIFLFSAKNFQFSAQNF